MHGTLEVLHESPESGLTMVGGRAYSAPRGRDFPPHRHTVWEIVYYREGNIRCPVGDQEFSGQPGVILSMPPGIVHAEAAVTA